MSCLINSKQRESLRVKIASDLLQAVKDNKAIDINAYIKNLYTDIKTATNNEPLALDAARLVPLMAHLLLITSPQIKKLRTATFNAGVLETLELKYEDEKTGLESLRTDLALNISPVASLAATQLITTQKVTPNPIVVEEQPPVSIFNFLTSIFSTVIAKLKKEPESRAKLNETVKNQISNEFNKQLSIKGITDSSELELPGVDGIGVFLTIKSGSAWKNDKTLNSDFINLDVFNSDFYAVLTDRNGNPILFNGQGNVSSKGQAAYYKIPEAPPMINGELDFSEQKTQYKQFAVDNIKLKIEKLIKARTPQGVELSAEETLLIKTEATKEITNQVKTLAAMQDYLLKDKSKFVTTAISSGTESFVIYNNFVNNQLAQVDLSDGFSIIQANADTVDAFSNTTLDNFYLNVPGISKPIILINPAIKDTPFIDTVISLYTDDLYVETASGILPITLNERLTYIENYMPNGLGGISIVEENNITTIQIDSKSKVIDYSNPNSIKEVADALKEHLSKSYLLDVDENYKPKDTVHNNNLNNALNNDKKREKAEKDGANIIYIQSREDLAIKVNTALQNLDSKKHNFIAIKNGTKYDILEVRFHNMQINKKAAKNGTYTAPEFVEIENKQVVKNKENSNYFDLIKSNFSTTAELTDNNKIKQTTNSFSYAPLTNQLTKFISPTAVPKSVASNPSSVNKPIANELEGKIVFITPGSGKDDFTNNNQDVVDVDKLTMDAIAAIAPDFMDKTRARVDVIMNFYYNANQTLQSKVNDSVASQIKELAASGKTVVHSSPRYIKDSDVIFVQRNPEILKNAPGYDQNKKELSVIEELQKEGATKEVINIYDYAPIVFKQSLSELKEVKPEVKEEKPVEQTNDALTQKTTLSVEQIKNSLINNPKFLEKGSKQKATNERSTEEQINAALDWFNKSPLKIFPFEILFAAVNSSEPGPVAQWAVNGITLFEYYDAEGNLVKSASGDYTDLYHEAWHGFTQTFLTEEQRSQMYSEIRKKAGSFTDYQGNYVTFDSATVLQLEEYLAEDFRAYMLSGGKVSDKTTPVKNSLFRKIINFLRALFGKAKVSDVVAEPTGYGAIQELYEKLKIGDLANYNFNVDNRDKTIGVLNHALLSAKPDDVIKALSYENSMLLSKSIDSIISDIINDLNKDAGVHSYTAGLMKDADSAKQVYTLVRDKFENTYLPKQKAKLEAAKTEDEKSRIQKNIDLLEYLLTKDENGVDNFGDIDNLSNNKNGKGLIYFHQMKSKYLSLEDREAFFDEIDETKQLLTAKDAAFDRSGADTSMFDLAHPDVHALLKGIHKYENGVRIENTLGIDELTEEHIVWNKIAKLLNGVLSRPKMYAVLRDAARTTDDKGIVTIKDPILNELVEKLGPSNTKTTMETQLWLSFWQTFCKANIPLIQLNLEKTAATELEPIKYQIKAGEASATWRTATRYWENAFRTVTNDYIKYDPTTGTNDLDIKKVLADFYNEKTQGILPGKSKIDFLNAIGIRLDYNKEVENALNTQYKVATSVIMSRLWDLVNLKKIDKVYSIKEIFSGKKEDKDGKNALGSISNTLKDLAQIQLKHSDSLTSFMVTTAEGTTQFEQSLHNTISIIISTINEVEDDIVDNKVVKTAYEKLMSLPHMAHLNIDKNPWAAKSKWLASIFDFTKGGTKRKSNIDPNSPSIKINLTNVSGSQYISDEYTDGISSSGSDEFTKLITDFHVQVMIGKPELMRHADKSTSFSAWVDSIFNPNKPDEKDNHLYVNTHNFFEVSRGKVKNVPGYDEAYNFAVKGYLDAEVQRIARLKAMSKTPNLKYDANYLEQGQNIIVFEDVLNKKTRNKIIDAINNGATNLEEVFAKLKDQYPKENIELNIRQQVASYFNDQYIDIREQLSFDKIDKNFGEGLAIDKSLIKKTVTDAKAKSVSDVTYAGAKEALIRSYVVNNWIHNIESMSMIYGDVAQYNLMKEEFHKRNAGAGSTGEIFATDLHMLNYVNNKGRRYAASLRVNNPDIIEKKLATDGSYDTAILADNVIPSAYLKEIRAAISEDAYLRATSKLNQLKGKELEEFKSALEQKINDATSAYTEMEEGNAQGWITFDFYRAVSMLSNKWSDKQEQLYNDIIDGKNIDLLTIKEFFPVKKYQYWGALKTEDSQLPLNAFHKFSLMPLIPTLIKGTNLEKLHDKMVAQEIDYATFKTGSKVSNITEIDENGNAVQDEFYKANTRELSNRDFTKNTVYLQFLKDQLEIAPKYKGTVTFPTQMRKLIENGLIEGGVPTDFDPSIRDLNARRKAWNALSPEQKLKESPKFYKLVLDYESSIAKLTKLKMKNLTREVNLEVDDFGNVILNESLQNFLTKELTRQDLGEHEINFIKVGEDNKLARDLSLSLSSEKLEKILTSIVVKRLVKQKVNGEGLIQVAGTGWESSTLRGTLTEEEQKEYGTNDLPFYQREVLERDANGEPTKFGKTKAMKVKISLQGDFMFLLDLRHKDGKIIGDIKRLNEMLKDEEWLNQGDHRDMVTIIGPRIPTQENNSMEFAEVYEFLPTYAGNIVILPSEIVAKSGGDFDIDKITFMYPNIQGVNLNSWLKEDAKDKLAALGGESSFDFSLENISRIIKDRRSEDLSDDDKLILDVLIANSTKNVEYAKDQNTEEGLENSVLKSMRAILETKENYLSLVRPNATDLVKPLADDLAQFVMDYKPKQRRDTEHNDRVEELKAKKSKTKEEKDELKALDRISGTKVFEIQYNLYKHKSNNIGKQTLGLGAVDNTYNTVLNRIGAHMLHDYVAKDKSRRRIDMLFKHNILNDSDGKPTISLSHLYDANNETSISSVIAQLINGWVDIAKDAWIFNLQANKEISGALLFMIQAGVPFKQAVYMVSHPLIRAYVDEQRQAKSTFSDPLGKAPENPMFFRNKARTVILTDPKYKVNLVADSEIFQAPKAINTKNFEEIASNEVTSYTLNENDLKNIVEKTKAKAVSDLYGTIIRFANPKDKAIQYARINKAQLTGDAKNPLTIEFTTVKSQYDKLMEYTNKDAEKGPLGTQLDFFNEDKVEENLLSRVKDNSNTITEADKAVLLHFFEIEDFANAVKQVKMNTGFDTKRTTNLFDAQSKIELLASVRENAMLPESIVDDILANSPIGSFYIQDYMIKLWGPFFKIRNNSELNNLISNYINDKNNLDTINSTWGNKEAFVNKLRNALPSYIFQNSFNKFDLTNATSYKGVAFEEEIPLGAVQSLKQGVFMGLVDNKKVLYLDKTQLRKQYDALSKGSITPIRTVDGNVIKFAELNSKAFPTAESYYKFIIEREILRSRYPTQIGLSLFMERSDVKDKYDTYLSSMPKQVNETQSQFEARISTLVYEETLRDMALNNTYNMWNMFESKNSMADQLIQIQTKYPSLKSKFSVLQTLGVSAENNIDGYSRIANIVLNDMMLNADKVNIFYENLSKLADPKNLDIDGTYEEKKRVADFFTRLQLFAFFQSGMNATGVYSLNRIVNQDTFTRLMSDFTTTPILAPVVKDITSLKKAKEIYNSDKENNVWTMRPSKDVVISKTENYGNPWVTEENAMDKDPKSKTFGKVRTWMGIITPKGEAAKNYYKWLTTTEFDNNPELLKRKQWILNQIDSGALDGKTLIYYKPSEYRSHVDALKKVIDTRRSKFYNKNNISNFITSDFIKTFVENSQKKRTRFRINNMVQKPKLSQTDLEETLSSTLLGQDNFGTLTYDPSDFKLNEAKSILFNNSDKVFFINGAIEAGPYINKGEGIMLEANLDSGNVVSMPTQKIMSAKGDSQLSDVSPEEAAKITEGLKPAAIVKFTYNNKVWNIKISQGVAVDILNVSASTKKSFLEPVLKAFNSAQLPTVVAQAQSSTSVENMTLKEYADKTSAKFVDVKQVLRKDDIEYYNDRVNDLIADRLKYAIFAEEDLNNRQYLPFINKLKENGFIQVEGMPWVFSKNGVNPKEEYAKLTTQAQVTEVKPGVEISSNTKGLAAALTNPTELAKSKGNLTQSYPVEFRGKTYKDAEEAYQALKSTATKDEGPNSTYNLMVNILKAKLQQHPRLVTAINGQGGSQWILSSTHQPTKANTVWETGGRNWFIKALNAAYTSIAAIQTTSEVVNTAVVSQGTYAELPVDSSKTLQPINGLVINPSVKQAVDLAINNAKEQIAAGKKLVFPVTGIGQGMLQINPTTGLPIAKATFVYLSQQLLKNFGYHNPGIDKLIYDREMPVEFKEAAPVDNQSVEDNLLFCFK